MKRLLLKKSVLRSSLFIVFCFIAFIGTAKAGLDHYEIYIGKKLIFKRAVNQPLSLETLPLSQANANEQLIIYYYQCNVPDKIGTNRTITLKDADGNKIKEWKFTDAKGPDKGMSIPVKELLQLQKMNKNSFALFYSADGKVQAEKLAFVSAGSKTVGAIYKKQVDKSNLMKALLI
jgi:hypothetical protein